MFLILNAIIASLDGLIIGISLKLSKIKLTIKNNLIFLLTNIFIYTLITLLYYNFEFKFMTTGVTTILYLILAWNAFKSNEEEITKNNLSILNTIAIGFSHSIDGSIVSLNFVYTYNLLYIITLFSFISLITLLIGYYFANNFKRFKKSNTISALLFILLAFLNLVL